jgi:hypothetical protein
MGRWMTTVWYPKFHLNVSSHFKQKEHLHFRAKRVCSYLLSVFVVYHSCFSIVFTMNPPVSWASSSVLLVCSCQTLPDFWVFFLCSCQVSRLQPPFAASGHLVLCLCVTPVQTFSLLVGPHGKGHQNIFVMHCICEDIKSCMHFMTLKILDSCLPNVELDERLTWEIHRQEEERNPSSNWIENHVDYYLLNQAGQGSAENQIFLIHSLPVTVIFARANFHAASISCNTFLLQWYMFSDVSVNKIYLHELLRASLHIWNEIPCCWATEAASFASPPKVGVGSTQEHPELLIHLL